MNLYEQYEQICAVHLVLFSSVTVSSETQFLKNSPRISIIYFKQQNEILIFRSLLYSNWNKQTILYLLCLLRRKRLKRLFPVRNIWLRMKVKWIGKNRENDTIKWQKNLRKIKKMLSLYVFFTNKFVDMNPFHYCTNKFMFNSFAKICILQIHKVI